ncbi:MAG: hypothetical protein RL885_33225 [Planctomycetota bacterium]
MAGFRSALVHMKELRDGPLEVVYRDHEAYQPEHKTAPRLLEVRIKEGATPLPLKVGTAGTLIDGNHCFRLECSDEAEELFWAKPVPPPS